MSVVKLLSRIVNPDDIKSTTNQSLHDYTFGITLDPLLQLASVVVALIHDVDHQGILNTQLMVENPALAAALPNRTLLT